MLQQQLRNSCKLMFVVAGERRLSVGSSLSSETGRSWSSRQEATGMSTFCYCTMFIGLSNYHIGPYRRAWTEQLDLEIAHLVGCLRSEVQVSASFQSSCPPRGSVRVRTLPDLCPRGETQTVSHIVESCPLTKLNGSFSRLHSADEDAVSWMTNYDSLHAYEKKDPAWWIG